MSFQYSNKPRTLESKQKQLKLSEIIEKKHMSNGDSLCVNFSSITEIDKIPGFYLKITKLNLSHNNISDLGQISQFNQLTHLNISHNSITNIQELLKISYKEKLVVLCLEGNPCFRHPDIISLVLIICPRLVEFDGTKISDHTRQDIADGMQLTRKLIGYLCKNEEILHGLDKDVKKLKIEFEILQNCKGKMNQENGPF